MLVAINENNWKNLVIRVHQGHKSAYRQLLVEMEKEISVILETNTEVTKNHYNQLKQDILESVHKALDTYRPATSIETWFLAIAEFRIKTNIQKNKVFFYSQNQPFESLAPIFQNIRTYTC